MIKDNKDKFNFFVPAEFIIKGGKNGKKEMYIKGIASSEVEDSDGEILVPSGYDLSPLLTSGFLNYNHQGAKDPEAIIGQPTKAEIINNGKDLYIEGFLYPDSIAAQKTYNLAKVLEKNSPDRRMGFSIEGKALEKDPLNPKRITKARITGVAITPCPKNPNTLLSIMKGEYAEPFVEEANTEDLEKGGPGSGRKKLKVGSTYKTDSGMGGIFHVKYHGKEGDKHVFENVTNKEFGGPKYRVADDKVDDWVLDSHEDIDKAMTAAGGEGVTQTEDVDGGKKVFEKLLEDKNLPKNIHLKKSDVYSLIISRYSDYFGNDIEKAKQIFSLVKEFNTKLYSMENTNGEILSGALEKAFSFIDEKIDEIKKSKEDKSFDDEVEDVKEDDDKSSEKESDDKKDDVEKSASEDTDIEKGVKEEFKIEETPVQSGKYSGVDIYLKTIIKESLEKGMSSEEIISDMVIKGCDEEFVTNLVKSVEDEMSKLAANGGVAEDGLETSTLSVEASTHSPKSPTNHFAKSEDAELIKSEIISSLEANQARLVEGIEQRFNSLSTILKSYSNELSSLKEISKGLKEENTNLKKSLADANNRIEAFASTPQRAKSIVSSKQIERFGGDIQKSETGKDVYSLSDRAQVKELTSRLTQEFESRIQKGETNRSLENAILELSLTGEMKQESIVGIKNILGGLNIEISR